MKLEIIKIADRGTLNSEVVTMQVKQICNLNRYMIVDTTYNKNTDKISNEHRHSYWFRSKEVKVGDIVLLYTRSGTDETVTSNGTTYHKYFWNSGSPIWNNTGDTAVLFEINTWKTYLAN